MEKKKTHKIIKKTGKYIKLYWKKLSKKNNIKIIVSGIDSIPQFSFEKENQKNKTFLTQEMLKKGYLASNIVYVSTVHTRKILNKYFLELDLIFKRISLNKNTLDGKIAHTEFKRLN